MDIERRNFAVQELRVHREDGKPPMIVGHAAVFDSRSQDLGGFVEEIAPGAFADAIKTDDVRALYNHDPNHVLGRNTAKTLRLKEDEAGLAIEIDPPDTQMARDLLVSMERGDITQMSFGFSIKPDGESWGKDGDQTVRRLTSVNLYDVSPVTYPAYLDTDVAVRSYSLFMEAQKIDYDLLRCKIKSLAYPCGKIKT